MNHTKEELVQLAKGAIKRRDALIEEYRRTHKIPSRGTISTPEIDAERAKIKEYELEIIRLTRANEK